MLYRLRATGPVVLVPLAWGVVAAAHRSLVTERTLLVAHLVMFALLVAFAALSRADMTAGALRVWWLLIVAGLVPTAAGAVGLLTDFRPLLWVALLGWAALPAIGLWDTGQRGASPAVGYLASGALSALGAVACALGVVLGTPAILAGLVAVGVGQTAGIAAAVLH
ncbi:hypothetical protein SAMN04488065_1232 [Haloplanus vescus]|uniref:Uncharacterized protein n=1 Tax=Haloplanus vescus TaxID=555874 RepID=A0A1H3X0L2_9EURY|nr:hypothetical protein [Haloplanus vescus]SDZ92162.1 hypothetical protein SAMN04488065_1232 [Haloplanus vescus]